MLHARISAVRADGAFIRDRLPEINARIPKAINAAKNLRPDHAPKRLIAWISSAVVDVSRVNRRDNAVLVERHAGVAKRSLVSVRARNHVLRAGFHPFDGPTTRLFGSQRAHRHLRVAGDLDAKTAADIESLHANLVD